MTDIQVKYWNVEESKRHNSATEAQARNELAETGRHNLVTEAQNLKNIAENVRHNKKTEKLTAKQIRETRRHNIVSENVSKRSNVIANKQANAALTRANADAALSQARTAAQQWQNEWRGKNPSLASLKEAGLVSNEKVLTTALTSGALGIDVARTLGRSVPDGKVIKDSDIIKLAEQGVKDGTIIRISEGKGKVTYVAPFLTDSRGRTIKATFRKKGY